MLLLSLKSYPAFCLLNDHLFQSQVLFINHCIQQAIKRCISQDIFKHNAESIDSNATLSVYINLLIDTLPQTFYIQKNGDTSMPSITANMEPRGVIPALQRQHLQRFVPYLVPLFD